MANLFSELPSKEKQVVKEGATTLLWFEHPAERFLIVTDEATANMLTDKLRGEAELNNSQQWLALNIEAGFPVIDAANSGQFIHRRPISRRWAVSALKRLLYRTRDGGASKIPWCQQTRALVADR